MKASNKIPRSPSPPVDKHDGDGVEELQGPVDNSSLQKKEHAAQEEVPWRSASDERSDEWRERSGWQPNDWQKADWKQNHWQRSHREDWRCNAWQQSSSWERPDWQQNGWASESRPSEAKQTADEATSSASRDRLQAQEESILRLQAQEEGILEAKQHTDGTWYVKLGQNIWKSVSYDFYCPLCDSEMSLACLSSHLSGDKHRRRLAASRNADDYHTLARSSTHCPPCSSTATSQQLQVDETDDSPSPTPPSMLPMRVPGNLERWQEIGAEGIKCIPCDKYCDGFHEHTPEHIRRVALFLEALEDQYREPIEPWLAWLPCKECGEGRYLRCLLCKKWVQDFEGTDTRHYDGQHGKLSVKNQKGHLKKMENLDAYKADAIFWNALLAERSEYHPAAAGSATSSHARRDLPTSPPLQPPAEAVDSELPNGWHAEWCPIWEQYYYYSDNNGSQWEKPTAPSQLHVT